ncbi:MAG: ferritin-like domain-containing protein, partial [Myxococcales bacterium]|nr:ferritin-like domain-containing protein [Myxococcales bacterium]
MKRTHSLSALFAGLLAACGSETTSTTTDASDSWDSSCSDIDQQGEYEVPRSDVEALVEEDGTLSLDSCRSLCTDLITWGDVTGCEALDPVMPAATSGDDPTTGAGTTGAGDGTTGPGDGTTSDDGGVGSTTDEESTTGSEDTDGTTTDTTGMADLVTLRCDYVEYCLGGRGHQALRSRPEPRGEDVLAYWLAATAHSEAASVVAFLALGEELRAHGAPEALVRRAREAAMDEVAHAQAMRRLARARGATVQEPSFGALVVRDLETIATENAVEGCVRETWAAPEAAHQAQTAADPELRAVMAQSAADETRHAE